MKLLREFDRVFANDKPATLIVPKPRVKGWVVRYDDERMTMEFVPIEAIRADFPKG